MPEIHVLRVFTAGGGSEGNPLGGGSWLLHEARDHQLAAVAAAGGR